jgi:hypothetical protein
MLACVHVQRNIRFVLTDVAMAGNSAICFALRWIIIALRQRQLYAAFRVYGRFSVCFGSIPLAAGRSLGHRRSDVAYA